MMDFKLIAETRVNPTEDEAKVERALHNIFPSEPIHREKTQGDTSVLRITGTDLQSLSTLRSLIKQERIRSAARSILLRTSRGERIRLYLNKQAAYMGRVSFCGPAGESSHGPISIEIDTPDPQSVIDFLAFNPAQDFGREPIGRRKR